MATETNVQPSEKQEMASRAEATREGPVYQPAVDIFEDGGVITVLADMPGVTPERLKIDLREDVLTLRGEVMQPEGEGEGAVIREFGYGTYFRQFSLAETIDQAKIQAQLRNGVLRLTLPKVEKAKPRTITVSAG